MRRQQRCSILNVASDNKKASQEVRKSHMNLMFGEEEVVIHIPILLVKL